jgi:hypothetical protein
MADKDEWGVAETKPAAADDWGVSKRSPSDSAQGEAIPVAEAEPVTEAEKIAIEPPAAPAEAAPERKRTAGENAVVGGTIGAIRGILQKYFSSQDKLQREVYSRALKNTLLEAGIDLSAIKDEASLIETARSLTGQQITGKQAELANLEQQAAQFRSMIPPEPPVSTGFPSPLEDLAQAGRASGQGVEGESGISKWMRAMAGQSHQVPDVIRASAEDMTKANPKGGQALINQDLANLQKINQLGGSDYRLAGQGRGQLMLPPEAAANVTAQESARAAEASAQESARLAQQADVARDALKIIQPQIVTVQAEIARLQSMGRDVSAFTRRLEELRRMEGLAQRALKGGLTFPQQANMGVLPRFGMAMGGKGFVPFLGNVMSGAGAAYDITEAFDRASNKDPLGAAVHVVSGALNMMAMVPPQNTLLATTKALGTLGSIPMLGVKAAMAPEQKTDVRQITQPGGLLQVPQQMIMDYLREKFPSMR